MMDQVNQSKYKVRAAVRAVLAGGTAVAAVGVVRAQEAPAPAPQGENPAIQEVVVTGSRIAVPNQSSISPVTFVSAQDLQQTGVTRVEDLLNQLPQVFADQNSNVSNGASGTASINLRGLGANRTLVLVNGTRLGPGDPVIGGQSDVNMIPVEMIDSIEVLTGGASATYGADAVAGVVNFKLNDHFEGVKIVADAGVYQHSNNNIDGVQQAITNAGFVQAPSSVWPGAQRSFAFIAGVNSPDGNGNATFYVTYRNVLPVLQGKYSYSACTLGSGFLGNGSNATGGKFTCSGSLTGPNANLFNQALPISDVLTVGPHYTTVPFSPASLYNYGPANFYQRPDERYTSGAFLHYDFNEHASLYSNTMWMDDYTNAQVAPSGDFATSGPIPCSNPYLMANATAWAYMGCTSAAGTTNPNVLLLRRDVEGGDRQNSLEHMDIREVIGIKGKIDNAWSYDANWNYSLVNLQSINSNFFSTTKLNNAFDVTGSLANPASIGCAVGSPCVPYNIFTTGAVTPAMLNYLYAPGLLTGRVSQTDVQASLTGDFGQYGVQSPWANSGLELNFGGEYRDARSSVLPDEESQTGDLSGSGGPTPPVSGGIIAREGFAELRMPLIENKPAFQSLDLEAGYRYSDYNLGFKTNTYKVGLQWTPVSDVRLRGSFQRAVRAPNVVELFTPAAIGLDGTYSADPCAGAHPAYTAQQCARTGVIVGGPDNQYGNIAANPAAQYNGLLGGNSSLEPETALTGSFGVGWTPSFLPNFRAQIDYYNIKIENVIAPIGGGVILNACGVYDLTQYCDLIHRNPSGSLWATTQGYIEDALANVGALQEKGIDVDIGYRFDVPPALGKIVMQLQGTYLEHYQVTPSLLFPTTAYDCAGLYGPICSGTTATGNGAGTPIPRWRHRFSATWQAPWQDLDITLAWRYIGPVRLELLSSNPNLAAPPTATIANGGISNTDAYLSSYSYFDLTAAVKVAEKVTFRVGCNNLLDKAPPLIGSTDLPGTTGNGNTFPGFYDSLGRFLFAELTAQF
jgi:iron complex outermembrane recepter protein